VHTKTPYNYLFKAVIKLITISKKTGAMNLKSGYN